MSARGRAAGRPLSAPALALVLLLTGCAGEAGDRPDAAGASVETPHQPSSEPHGGGSPAGGPSSRPPAALTPADDGAVVPLRVGGHAELLVPGGASVGPQVMGGAVELVEVLNAAATGHREWEVRAVRPGTGVVRGAPPERWALTFRVAA
jgi:hypothetical protein